MSKRYKYCIVPECPSTSLKTPDKLFISLPNDEEAREAWQRAMRRMNFVSSKGSKFCCEDHFNVTEDIENYMYVKMMKTGRIRVKPGVIPHIFNCQQDRSVTHSSLESQSLEVNVKCEKEEEVKVTACHLPFEDVGIQVDLKFKTQSEGMECNLLTQTVEKRKLANTSPPSGKKIRGVSVSGSGSNSSFDIPTSSACSSSGCLEKQNCKEQIQKSAICIIEKNPKLYLGIPNESLFLVKMLSENANLTKTEIFLTLKKIRMNLPYSTLADDFYLSTTDVCLIIHKSIPKLAASLKSFIQWKTFTKIQNHKEVQCITDCFEISIKKPSDPILQSLTWSNHKNCNTMKYLMSCTSDGSILFISKGFGGRSTDEIVVEESGFLDLLEPGNQIMTDRQLTLKNNKVVFIGLKNSKQESKRISNLRIHVERVISRIMEFRILHPDADIQLNVTKYLDFIIQIICGIINIQNNVVKI